MISKNLQETENTLLKNYEKYYRLAYSYTKNKEDALDVVQESAYKAIRDCSKVENPAYLPTWIYRIVINTAVDLLRKQQKDSSCTGIPEERCGREDIYRDPDLENALNSLNQTEKTIITLRYFEDLRLEDVARIMNLNQNTVKAKLYRGLKKLRAKME